MTPSPSIPTLEDVARVAGVSTATVSRCINEKEKVSKKTLAKVLHAIDTLGYTPNFNARAMAAKRSFTIGAIIPTMDNAIFARGLQAFQESLHDMGYNLLVSSSAYRPELEAEQIRALIARGADGLLLIGHERSQSVYDFLTRRGVPFVLAWSLDRTQNHAAVGFDNRASMRKLADEVIGLGHRRIALISGHVEGNDRARNRVDGVRDSLRAHGLPPESLRVVETTYEMETGAAAFVELMQSAPAPTAIMCGNDVLAAGAISKARDMGIRVPQDVSITGFDDMELAKHVSPALATVHVPHRNMGRIAAETLVSLINGATTRSATELETSVVLRGSLAAPKAESEDGR